MGAYYGLYNLTKNQRVSSYWKRDPYCNIEEVMHVFGWDITDIIISAAYDGLYLFEFDVTENAMTYSELEPDDPKNDIIKRAKLTSNDIQERKFGYPGIDEQYKAYSHAPKWNNNVCGCCQYKFDENNLPELEKMFNGTFYMN